MLAFILKATLVVGMEHEMSVGLPFNNAEISFKHYLVIVSEKANLGRQFSGKCAGLQTGVVNE